MATQKYHIDKGGKAGACTAIKRPCPLGGEHYDSLAEAMKASMANEVRETAPVKDVHAMNGQDLRAYLDAGPGSGEEADIERYMAAIVEAERRDKEATRVLGKDAFDAEVEWREKQLTPEFETKARRFNTEFYKGLEEARNNGLGGNAEVLHRVATRSATRADLNSFEKVVATNRLTQKHWKQDLYKLPAPPQRQEPVEAGLTEGPRATSDYNRDPHHYYGPWKGKVSLDVSEGPARTSSGPKELDPEMIEALKLKYMKKFKQPFDESGLSIPELLQMAQKGELD